MSRSFYKGWLVVVAVLLLAGAGWIQKALNRQRADPALDWTRVAPLENAPPMLAFTTVALGGFRGLIANALWLRASDLQDEGKYFELVQLADWITKLEPHFVQVWLFQAWNMSYNISVKFSDPGDRWRWVQRGIELLRDQALRYNPREALLYRELAWHFQHKMGQNLDDAHLYYKGAWAWEMTRALGSGRPDFNALLQPSTEEARQRVLNLREKYRLDPQMMKQVDDAWGGLDWRLPETHAIYWASVGLKESRKKDLITLRRVIYQSMHVLVLRGRLLELPTNAPPRFGPDLTKVDRAQAAYEQMLADDPEMRDVIQRAHRNFLLDATWLLYSHNRQQQADRMFRLLKEKYPNVVPAPWTAEDYALQRVAGDINTLSSDRIRALIEGLIGQHFQNLVLDDDERAAGLRGMAQSVWRFHDQKYGRQPRLALPPYADMERSVRDRLLDPQTGLAPDYAARLRNRLGLPAPATAPTKP